MVNEAGKKLHHSQASATSATESCRCPALFPSGTCYLPDETMITILKCKKDLARGVIQLQHFLQCLGIPQHESLMKSGNLASLADLGAERRYFRFSFLSLGSEAKREIRSFTRNKVTPSKADLYRTLVDRTQLCSLPCSFLTYTMLGHYR